MKKVSFSGKLGILIFITIFLFSCTAILNENSVTHSAVTTSLEIIEPPKAITQWETSLSPTYEKADLVIRATVTNIGQAFLLDNVELSPSDDDIVRYQKLQSIRTPVTLTVNEVYKGNISQNDSIVVNEFYGIYEGYNVLNYGEPLAQDTEYILFIKQSKIGNGNILYGQCTVKITSESTSPFSWWKVEKDFIATGNEPLYEPYANSDEIIAAIRALGEAS